MDNTEVINTFTDSLGDIAWMLVGTYIVVVLLAMGWKILEKKLLSMVDKKIYEARKKKAEIKNSPNGLTLEEQELANQIRIDRSKPSFEEWVAAKEKEQEGNNWVS